MSARVRSHFQQKVMPVRQEQKKWHEEKKATKPNQTKTIVHNINQQAKQHESSREKKNQQ